MNPAAMQSAADASKTRSSNALGRLGPMRRFIAPAVARPFAIVEAAGFVALVLAVSRLCSPHDPLLLQAGFPWLWFAPMIVALRYGTLLGLFGGALMVAAWKLGYPPGAPWPVMMFAGGLLQTVIAGHFGDTWGHRARRASTINDYLNERLVAITNSHYLMRLSHERLEKDLLSKPTTLRDSITELRRLSVSAEPRGPAEAPAPLRALPSVAGMLEFVAQVCQIEIGAVFPVRDDRPATEAVAHVGDAFSLVASDDLVLHALRTRSVAHLRGESADIAQTDYLVCAPLVSADGEVIALLVVRRMPFLSLNFDSLQLLLVLLAYYADGVEHASVVRGILADVPGCPYDFALDLGRLSRLQRDAGIASSLVALAFPRGEEGDSLFEHVLRRRRALDLMWPLQTASHSVLVNLMPATDTTGVDGYLARIENSLDAQFGLDMERAHIGVHTLHLGALEPGAALQRLLKRSGADV
ncbi:PelD GGDEF domain-containing protein [Burkholderia sp. 22PA0106]|uniref:PelD GGDEF domain-containing protein n=1 Tax=Burkholderia sp. 22PA0106 TaxID=3237371 RepID=UPI0039C0741B